MIDDLAQTTDEVDDPNENGPTSMPDEEQAPDETQNEIQTAQNQLSQDALQEQMDQNANQSGTDSVQLGSLPSGALRPQGDVPPDPIPRLLRAPKAAPGEEKEQALKMGGATDAVIQDWKDETREILRQGGATETQIREYFGNKESDKTEITKFIHDNLQRFKDENKVPEKPDYGRIQRPAQDFWDATLAGLQLSNLGWAYRDEPPNVVVAENAPNAYHIMQSVGQIAGDFPSMVAGGFLGQAANPELPVVGGWWGAGALPAAIRKYQMEAYENKTIDSPDEFMGQLSGILWEGIKGGVTNVATMGVGGKVGSAVGGGVITNRLAQTAAEVGTMTTVSAGLEGKMPKPIDYVNGALVLGGTHFALAGAAKLRGIYYKTGKSPADVVQETQNDPVMRQEILSDNTNVVPFSKIAAEEKANQWMKQLETDTNAYNNANIKDRMLRAIKANPTVQNMKELTGKVYDNAYDALFDFLKPVVDMQKSANRYFTGDEDANILMHNYKHWGAKFRRAFDYGMINYAQEKVGEPLRNIFRDVPVLPKDHVLDPAVDTIVERFDPEAKTTKSPTGKAWNAYLTAKTVIRRSELDAEALKKDSSYEPKETGVDLEAAKKVVEVYGKQFEGSARRLSKFKDQMLEYVAQSGRFSQGAIDQMKAWHGDTHAALHRLLDENPLAPSGKKSGALRKFEGSGAKIIPPMESVVDDLAALMKLGEQTRYRKALRDVIANHPEQEKWGEKVDAPTKVTNASKKEVQKWLKDNGVDVDLNKVTDAQMEIFRKRYGDLKDNEFDVYDEGERTVWRVNDRLRRAVKGAEYAPGELGLIADTFIRYADIATRTMKKGITWSLGFSERNIPRDFQDKLVLGKYRQNPMTAGLDVVKAYLDYAKKGDVWERYLSSGGLTDGWFSNSHNYLKELQKFEAEPWAGKKVMNTVHNGVEFWEAVMSATETAPRLAEAKRTGLMDGDTASLFEAGYASKEATVNFDRRGYLVQALRISSFSKFFTPGMAGLERTYRAVQDPETWIRGAAVLSTPAVALWLKHKDETWWKEMPNWRRMSGPAFFVDKWEEAHDLAAYSYMPEDMRKEQDGKYYVNNGYAMNIPVPHAVGFIFATLPVMVLDEMYQKFVKDDPEASKGFSDLKVAWNNAVMPDMSIGIKEPIDEFNTNMNSYTGRPLVPWALQEFTHDMHFTEYTSDTAKVMGRLLDEYAPAIANIPGGGKNVTLASPLVIDNFIRGWGGPLAAYAAKWIDRGLRATGAVDDPTKPDETIKDSSWYGAYIFRYPDQKMDVIDECYQRTNDATTAVNSVREALKREDMDLAEKVYNDHAEELHRFNQVVKGLSESRKFLRAINADRQMSGTDKRQLMDQTYWSMWQVSHVCVEQLNSFKASVEAERKAVEQMDKQKK